MTIISPLTIEKVVYGGQGLGRYEGKVVFVPFTIAKEKITARVTHTKKNYLSAEALRIIEADPERIAPVCPHFGSCGGCQFQHMDYPLQLKTKQAILHENIGSFIDDINVVGLSSHVFGYREHIKLAYQEGVLGYHGLCDKNVFALKMCPLFSDKLPALLEPLQQALKEAAIEEASIRLLKTADGFIAAITADQQIDPSSLLEHFKGVALKGPHGTKEYGLCHLTQQYLGKTFEMDIWSFMQNHTLMAEKLYHYALDQIPSGTKTLVDLYCGAGILSILAHAKNIPHITGIELNPHAIAYAKKNQCSHGAPELTFIAAPAEHLLKHVKNPIDYAIINPPREGLSAQMMTQLLQLEKTTLCYISCNPTTLRRDLLKFKEAGYELIQAKGFDLFPQTTHIETVCILKKKR